MKKLIAIAGLAALIAGASCSSEIKSKPFIMEHNNLTGVCNVDSMGYCSPNMMMYADSKSVTELTPENFDANVLENKLPVVVKFYAEWCGPCRNYKPIFEKVCADYRGRLVCGAYNTDQDDEETNAVHDRYGVTGIPATRFFHDGIENEEKRFSSGRPEEILRTLFDEFLEECGK